MERLENTLRSNASMELRLQQLDIKKDILRNKLQKGLGTRRASQIEKDPLILLLTTDPDPKTLALTLTLTTDPNPSH